MASKYKPTKEGSIIPQWKEDLQHADVSLGILAGGKGSRMGFRDKGLLIVDGQAIAGRLMANAAVKETLVVCKNNPWFYGHYADRILCDVTPDHGPVAGIVTLLAANTTPLLAIAPCDQRQLPERWIKQLITGLTDNPVGAYAADDGRHTACLLLRQSARPKIERAFDTGCRSLSALYEQLGLATVNIMGSGSDVDQYADLGM